MGEWDRKPMEAPSVWLRLKSKGESVKLRIVGSPYRELKIWPAEQGGKPLDQSVSEQFTPGQWMSILSNPDWNPTEVFYLVVIDRADGAAKIFTTTGGVYGKIRDYATDPEWGDPRGYDITITRTEAPGKNYYEVKPSPNKTPVLKSELAKVEALDLETKLAGARKASDPQPDDFDKSVVPEALPWDVANPATKPAESAEELVDEEDPAPEHPDVVIEDIGDEPINLDDIPF